jgi:hypothetical protein
MTVAWVVMIGMLRRWCSVGDLVPGAAGQPMGKCPLAGCGNPLLSLAGFGVALYDVYRGDEVQAICGPLGIATLSRTAVCNAFRLAAGRCAGVVGLCAILAAWAWEALAKDALAGYASGIDRDDGIRYAIFDLPDISGSS